MAKTSSATQQPFLTDIKTLRARARKHIEDGAVTAGYRADRAIVIKLLNEALATELVCVLRYKRHYFMAGGINADMVAQEFLQHATEEQGHADLIATRIVQLNGEPNFSPDGLAMRSHAEYVEGGSLIEMIKEDLVAERIAIESYGEMIRYIGDKDITTGRMLETILAMEEEHANDLSSLLEDLNR
ncbi:MAG: bacterioferritin [Hydrogenophilales bacterium 17-64-11]|nr:MAG: bacterioferritin [Hydrogenophilales bacterium 17-64-11]HRK79772.1 ferritin-like domain-containing protein [Thiobacillus sp.]